MIRRIKKTRKYLAPAAKVTQLVLESGLLQDSGRFNVQVQELDNINKKYGTSEAEPTYFEF
jgi:hypothetical protein